MLLIWEMSNWHAPRSQRKRLIFLIYIHKIKWKKFEKKKKKKKNSISTFVHIYMCVFLLVWEEEPWIINYYPPSIFVRVNHRFLVKVSRRHMHFIVNCSLSNRILPDQLSIYVCPSASDMLHQSISALRMRDPEDVKILFIYIYFFQKSFQILKLESLKSILCERQLTFITSLRWDSFQLIVNIGRNKLLFICILMNKQICKRKFIVSAVFNFFVKPKISLIFIS